MNLSECKAQKASGANQQSSSKRLYEAVYRLIDFDSQFHELDDGFTEDTRDVVDEDPELRPITNGQKISYLLNNQQFQSQLDQKLRLDGYYEVFPILKIEYNTVGGLVPELCLLDKQDLIAIFNKFGKLYQVIVKPDSCSGFALFTSYSNAYVACKILNGMSFAKQNVQISVFWAMTNQITDIMDSEMLQMYMETLSWGDGCYLQPKTSQQNSQKQAKLTCRYQIQIQNEKEFQVARRIIGSKGYNMKRIIEEAIDLVYKGNIPDDINSNELLKLRLRGKGSGYKEGSEQIQSEDNLHLCVSAKEQKIYLAACKSVQKLLLSVYNEYAEFTKADYSISIKKLDVCLPAQTNLEVQKDYQRVSPSRISQLLQMRNKARRQLNFLQADRIRNYLRNCGVCLIDEKGRRGKATEVTTWKYLF